MIGKGGDYLADYDVTVQGHLRGFEKLDEIEAKIQSLQGKSIDIKVNADGINNLNKTLTSSNLSSSISKQYKDVGKTAGTAYATGMQARIEEMARTQRTAFSSPLLTSDERAQQAFWKNQVSSTLEQANKYSNLVSTKAMSVKLSNLQTKAQGIDSGVENYNNLSAAIEKCVAAEQQLNTATSAYSASGTLDNANAMISAYDKLATSIQTANNELKITQNNASLIADTKKVADFQKSLQTFYDNNTRMHKQYGEQWQKLITDSSVAGLTNNQFKQLQTQASVLKKDISGSGLMGKSVLSGAKSAMGSLFKFASMYGIAQRVVWQVPKQIVQAVREVNAAQIELAKVTDLPSSTLNKYWDTATESAKKYGTTISDIISTTADWSRLGYNLQDAKELTDATALIQKVGDNMTQESSSEGMISVLKGFHLEASEASRIVDEVNEVNFAASVCSNTYALCA